MSTEQLHEFIVQTANILNTIVALAQFSYENRGNNSQFQLATTQLVPLGHASSNIQNKRPFEYHVDTYYAVRENFLHLLLV